MRMHIDTNKSVQLSPPVLKREGENMVTGMEREP